MNCRPFSQKLDYQEICSWWKSQNWPEVPTDYLPNFGFVVEDDTGPLCAGWLYRTDSKLCWLEWVVGNPKADWRARGTALDLLMEEAEQRAKALGYKIIFTSVRHPRLLERYKAHGYTVGDENMTNLVKAVK